MGDNPTLTYQSRLSVSTETGSLLSAYAAHYSSVERSLYADIRRHEKPAAAFKNEYLAKYGITARQFNAISINLKGKIDSVRELLPLRVQEKELAIAKAVKVIKKSQNKNKVHQKKRRLTKLTIELESLQQQKKSGDPRICFGSRKLFQKQFNLEINGYLSHQDWKNDWQTKRNSQFSVIGSKDETAGCQGCLATENIDGSFNLRLRLPDSIGKHVRLSNIEFKYGADKLRHALRTGQAISYRFVKDSKGWRIFICTKMPDIKVISIKNAGTIGVDINADCLAISEIDRFGNLASTKIVPLVTYGKSSGQAKALIGDVVKEVVSFAVIANKPIVIEKLEFKKKRAELEGETPGQARMLSSFACNQIVKHIHVAAYRAGIEVVEVNPAYTSTIGTINFAAKYGISVHQGAALAIARRGAGFRECPTTKFAVLATPKGDHVTFSLPARNREKHVWSHWSDIRKIQKAVLAAHLRPPLTGGTFAARQTFHQEGEETCIA